MTDIRVLFVTAPPEHADTLVRTLVGERLVACGNILAAHSTYVWQGELCREPEAVLFMETAAARVWAACARIRELHPYRCPKLIVIDPSEVNDDYAAWVLAHTLSTQSADIDAKMPNQE